MEGSVYGEGLENCAASGMSIFSWTVAKPDSRVLVGSSKVETVMSNCFSLTSIVWVRAIYIPLGQRDIQRCLGNTRQKSCYANERLRNSFAVRAPEEA